MPYRLFSSDACTGKTQNNQKIATDMKSFDPFPVDRISFRRRVLLMVIRLNALLALLFLTRTSLSTPLTVDAEAADVPSSSNPSSLFSIRLKENSFNVDRGDCDVAIDRGGSGSDKNTERRLLSHRGSTFYGFGREFTLLQVAPRGGARNENYNNDYSYDGYSDDIDDVDVDGGYGNSDGNDNGNDDGNDDDNYDDNVDDNVDDNYADDEEDDFLMRMERYRARRKSHSSISSFGNSDEGSTFSRGGRPQFMTRSQSQQRQRKQEQRKPKIMQFAQSWWTNNVDPKVQRLPKIDCRLEPTSTLKLRKTFRPLKTIIRLGADYNTKQGIWQFKSSWEDAIIGGKLTLSGNKELQMTKSWHLSVGGMEDLATRLRFRATINLQTFQAFARVGFRTERLIPIDVMEGFTILKRLPLDGSGGNLKLEVKANVALPEPEIEYSTEAQRSLIGMGNIEVSIDEMNLLLDY